jgi:RNA polymerase sigma-70 factor (ECF subfamily)
MTCHVVSIHVATGARFESLSERASLNRFEQAVLPHLNAAYNLARWLTRNDHDAEDVVQEAVLRALQFFDSFRGGDGRSWLLTIVRNTCYTRLERHRRHQPLATFDEAIHSGTDAGDDPSRLLLQMEDQQAVAQAVEELPLEFREVIVLREMEGLSYKEIASIAGIAMGTVMSRLARARERLQNHLVERMRKDL